MTRLTFRDDVPAVQAALDAMHSPANEPPVGFNEHGRELVTLKTSNLLDPADVAPGSIDAHEGAGR